jgi:hypothetical protein
MEVAMRGTAIGVFVGAGLVMLASWVFATPDAVFAYHGVPAADSESGLIALSSELSDGRQQLVVIDPKLRSVAVYQINPANGELALRCVRNINWDLRMTQFNGASPLPQEIRSMMEQN